MSLTHHQRRAAASDQPKSAEPVPMAAIAPVQDHGDVEIGTIDDACRVIGGENSPIERSTFYRGVKAGRYEAPFKVSPNCSRVNLTRLRRIVHDMATGRIAAE